jgi:hypothetical protein
VAGAADALRQLPRGIDVFACVAQKNLRHLIPVVVRPCERTTAL